MRGGAWLILILGVVAMVLAAPTSETKIRTVQLDGSEVYKTSASTPVGAATFAQNHKADEQHEQQELQASGSAYLPLVHALPQLSLLLQLLLQVLLDLSYKSPHLLHFHPGLLHTKALAGAHHLHHQGIGGHLGGHIGGGHIGGPFYGPGLYGVSATNSIANKGGPFGPYKYEANQ